MTGVVRSVGAIVPAAGASRRFGSAKLLHVLGAEPLLAHTMRALLDGGVARVIVVASPALDLTAVPAIGDQRVVTVINPAPERGMFSSILAGMSELNEDESALILPADMPFVQPVTVARVLADHQTTGEAVVAAYRERRGHPLLLPVRAWRAVCAHAHAPSLKAALAAVGIEPRFIDVDDPGVVQDVDERGDLERPEG